MVDITGVNALTSFTKFLGASSVMALLAVTPALAGDIEYAGFLDGSYTNVSPTDSGTKSVSQYGFNGAVKAGIYEDLNIQLDAGYDRVDYPFGWTNSDVWKIGGTAFFNSDEYRAGVNAKYTSFSDIGETVTYGAFGELFMGEITLGARAGAYAGDVHGWNIGLNGAIYLMEDLALKADVTHAQISHFANGTSLGLSGEYLFDREFPISGFAGYSYSTLTNGWSNAHAFKVGLRIYFNDAGSSLIERHRLGAVQANQDNELFGIYNAVNFSYPTFIIIPDEDLG